MSHKINRQCVEINIFNAIITIKYQANWVKKCRYCQHEHLFLDKAVNEPNMNEPDCLLFVLFVILFVFGSCLLRVFKGVFELNSFDNLDLANSL